MQLRYARSELENVGLERMKLQKHLQTAMKEHRMMELILAHLEDELDNAISKIHLLQDEVNFTNFSCYVSSMYCIPVFTCF